MYILYTNISTYVYQIKGAQLYALVLVRLPFSHKSLSTSQVSAIPAAGAGDVKGLALARRGLGRNGWRLLEGMEMDFWSYVSFCFRLVWLDNRWVLLV